MMGLRFTVSESWGVGNKNHSLVAALLVQYVQLNQYCSLIQMHGKHICTHTQTHIM